MLWTGLHACALTGLFVEDVVHWTGLSGRGSAHTLAGVAVEVTIRTTVLSLTPMLTHTLTGFNVQFLIWAANIC